MGVFRCGVRGSDFVHTILKSAAFLERTNTELERRRGKSLPYGWMQSLVVSVKEYNCMEPNRGNHALSKSIWTIVHEELRNKRQGRSSAMPFKTSGGGSTDDSIGGKIPDSISGRPPDHERTTGEHAMSCVRGGRAIGLTTIPKRQSPARFTKPTYKPK